MTRTPAKSGLTNSNVQYKHEVLIAKKLAFRWMSKKVNPSSKFKRVVTIDKVDIKGSSPLSFTLPYSTSSLPLG